MFSTEYIYQGVGGLGVHVREIAPRLADRLPLDLVVPRYNSIGETEEDLGTYGHLYRVDADYPHASEQFDIDVWGMNDQLNRFVSEAIERGRSYKLIHAHDWLSGYVANDLHRRYQIPLVATIHATELGRLGGNVHSQALSERIHIAERHLVNYAAKIIACSEFMRDEIALTLGVPFEKIVVIPNGVTVEHFLGLNRQRASLQDFRAEWLAPQDPLIFFIGRLVWQKGPDLLVAAMPEILQHYPGAKLVIAGRGPYESTLNRLIAQLGLNDNVYMVGFISDDMKKRLYAVSDMAVFPSRYEPFGIVALEAMAAGTPVIVSDAGGLREVVSHHKTGLCVPAGRADAVAAGILETLRDPEAAASRSCQAEEAVIQLYSWEYVAELTAKLYQELMVDTVSVS